jgi:hypothetical protein
LSGQGTETAIEIWDLWYPDAAARGLPFAQGRLRATDVLWVHAAPELLRVEVRDDSGRRLAFADALRRTAGRPMTKLVRRDATIERDDRWPEESDAGSPVILPGGEVGILLSWWNSDDEQEWRWQVEFYNHR